MSWTKSQSKLLKNAKKAKQNKTNKICKETVEQEHFKQTNISTTPFYFIHFLRATLCISVISHHFILLFLFLIPSIYICLALTYNLE